MNKSEKIFIKKDNLEKIHIKLKGLKIIIEDKKKQSIIDDIIKLLDDDIKDNEVSVEETIKNKMNETKSSNPEMHFKLYKLYRKLSGEKITEEEATTSYDLYMCE